MGTSGAYGGSGSTAWSQAHHAYAQAGPAAAGDAPASASGGGDATVEAVVDAVARALRRASRHAPSALGSLDVSGIGARRPGSGDGFTRSRGSGSRGSGGRGLPRQAARGAAAVGGAQAYRAGDAAALAELGLDLAQLRALPDDRARCSAIVGALLGAPAHPEDAALSAVTTQTMMDALRAEEPMSTDDLLDTFTANLAFELALVELTSAQRRDPLPTEQALAVERQSKQFIVNSLRGEVRPPSRAMNVQALIDKAAALAERVLNVFGRRQ